MSISTSDLAALRKTQKSSDWSVIQHEHPDIAGFITDFSIVFGKPEMVIVKDTAGDVLLDSRRYA